MRRLNRLLDRAATLVLLLGLLALAVAVLAVPQHFTTGEPVVDTRSRCEVVACPAP